MLAATHGQVLYAEQLGELAALTGVDPTWAERFRRAAAAQRFAEREALEQEVRAAGAARGWTTAQLHALLRLLRSRFGERGMSLTALARRTGLDKSYLYRLETGERGSPSWRSVILIARALELSERLTNELLERAYFAPLPPIEDYDGRYRRRGWGSRSA